MHSIVQKFNVPGPLLLKSEVFLDERGFFVESYKESDFSALGLPKFVQDNFSVSKKGVLRGLHFQLPPAGQGKLVRVLSGKIWDVAVDVRKNSPNFKQWVAVNLKAEDGTAFYISEGFAHGFAVFTDEARVLYKVTVEYEKSLERGIAWNDEGLNISWPVRNPLVSPKDKAFPKLKEAEVF